MPWLDITLRTGTLPKEKLHAMVARLSDVVKHHFHRLNESHRCQSTASVSTI
jgi:phenylpyruvate tautomerase PptA (4-oxalocrotonate tautomerase family)